MQRGLRLSWGRPLARQGFDAAQGLQVLAISGFGRCRFS